MRFRRLTTGAAMVLAVSAAPLAFAGQYPPVSDVAGVVVPSRIPAGECAVFSGEGFNPGVSIAVKDNGQSRGTSTTGSDGAFHKTLCYDSRTQAGKHVLRGTGDAPDSAAPKAAGLFRAPSAEAAVLRTVTATLIVTGITQTNPGSSDSGGITSLPRTDDSTGSGGLAFTGFPLLASALTGVVLVGGGSALLVAAEGRHRRRRRLA